MTPDEPIRSSADGPGATVPPDRPESSSGVRLVIMVLAVALAVVGLASLVAILGIAFFQGTVWPGFVLATYVCLPVAFLLMMALVLSSVRSRRRS